MIKFENGLVNVISVSRVVKVYIRKTFEVRG